MRLIRTMIFVYTYNWRIIVSRRWYIDAWLFFLYIWLMPWKKNTHTHSEIEQKIYNMKRYLYQVMLIFYHFSFFGTALEFLVDLHMCQMVSLAAEREWRYASCVFACASVLCDSFCSSHRNLRDFCIPMNLIHCLTQNILKIEICVMEWSEIRNNAYATLTLTTLFTAMTHLTRFTGRCFMRIIEHIWIWEGAHHTIQTIDIFYLCIFRQIIRIIFGSSKRSMFKQWALICNTTKFSIITFGHIVITADIHAGYCFVDDGKVFQIQLSWLLLFFQIVFFSRVWGNRKKNVFVIFFFCYLLYALWSMLYMWAKFFDGNWTKR